MIVIGFLLILVAVGAVGFFLMAPAATSEAVELTAIGVTVNATPLASFVAGATAVALIGLGFPMITKGIRHKVQSRNELHQLRKEQAASGPRTPAAAEERSSHRDRPEHGTSTDSRSTDDGTDASTGTTGSRTDTNTDASTGTTGSRTDTNTDSKSSESTSPS